MTHYQGIMIEFYLFTFSFPLFVDILDMYSYGVVGTIHASLAGIEISNIYAIFQILVFELDIFNEAILSMYSNRMPLLLN